MKRAARRHAAQHREAHVVDDVSFAVWGAKALRVLGPSGYESTTPMSKGLAALVQPAIAEVRIEGNRVDGEGEDGGVLFQDGAPRGRRRNACNVELGLVARNASAGAAQ